MKILVAFCFCVGFANAQDIVSSKCNFDEDLQSAARKPTATESQKKAAAKDRSGYLACLKTEYEPDTDCQINEHIQSAARKKNASESQKNDALDDRVRYIACESVQAEPKPKSASEIAMEIAVDKRLKVDHFCLAIYHQTIDKKTSELTVKQSKAIPACEELGLYREKPTAEEALEEFSRLPYRSTSSMDREDALRKYLLGLASSSAAGLRTK